MAALALVSFLLLLTLSAALDPVADRCALIPVVALCRARIPRYFFNPRTRKCQIFFWGGCGGVVPFETLQNCQVSCDPCRQVPATGPCKALINGWYYDNNNKRCRMFRYGGCLSGIPFNSKRKCRKARCTPYPAPVIAPPTAAERCLQKPDGRPCKGEKRRWYWDASTKKCTSFTWGGCFGSVPFDSREMCERAECANDCAKTPDVGPCDGAFKRWFYDKKNDKCDSFSWGGCGGTVPFETKSACSDCVEHRRTVIPDAGPCRGSILRYFYNEQTGKCDIFFWGGCGGVVPYLTYVDCLFDGGQTDICKLTPDPGPCRGITPRYFFNQGTGKCESFGWGGCRGRVPFDSLAACESSNCSVDKCKLIPDGGPCRGSFPRWFWNQREKKCDMFSYGGCQGIVPFETAAKCEREKCH